MTLKEKINSGFCFIAFVPYDSFIFFLFVFTLFYFQKKLNPINKNIQPKDQ